MAQARRRPRLRRTAAAVAAAALACSAGHPLDRDARFPALRAIRGERLEDMNPYVLPIGGEAVLFSCRWPTAEPVPIALAPDASPEERAALEAALHAWEHAIPGLRFREVDVEHAAIAIGLEDASLETGAGLDTANTVADCRLAPLSRQRDPARLEAELVRASIRIARRTNPDWQEHTRVITPAELAGVALHELGHALGFQGHARQGDTVMVREVEVVQRAGRRLLAGDPFEDATLRALYALPPGAVLSRTPVGSQRTEAVDQLAALAERDGLEGPYARVGEAAARLWWKGSAGREYGVLVPRIPALLRDPQSLVVLTESPAREALARGAASAAP